MSAAAAPYTFSKKKRTVVPLSSKIEILQKLESGFSSKSIAKEYGIGQSTVYEICKKSSRIIHYADMLFRKSRSASDFISLKNVSYIKEPKKTTHPSHCGLNLPRPTTNATTGSTAPKNSADRAKKAGVDSSVGEISKSNIG